MCHTPPWLAQFQLLSIFFFDLNIKAEEEARRKAEWAREEEEWRKRMANEEERMRNELNARRYLTFFTHLLYLDLVLITTL